MDVKRMLCAGSIAAGVGLAGIVGAATANAAPTPSNSGSGQQGGTSVKLDHHDRKEVLKQDKKELKHHPAQVTPTTGHS